MLCDNCGKREANIRYSENINGRKKELNLCEECSKKLGIEKIDFNMPIDFSSFFGGFMDNLLEPEFMPMLETLKTLKCDKCGYTFENIANTGKLGCGNCYEVFEERLDQIIRKIQGADTHVGRIGKILDNKITSKAENKKDIEKSSNINKDEKESNLEKLQAKLKQAIREERYEDAAKLRDEIRKESDK